MGWIGSVRCEKFQRDFVARNFALVRPVLYEFRKATKQFRMHPNSTKCTKTSVYGPMGWIGCVRCEKFSCDFMARTSALIVPVQLVLHRVLCSNETLPNAPKYYETQQNMSLGSKGMDRVRSLRKIRMRLCGTNFYINGTSSAYFVSSFVQ